MRQKLRFSGFTLVELSVVLIIISLITGMSMYYMKGAVDSARTAATQRKMDEIERALMAYRIAFDRLPCPADPSLLPTDANFAVEAGPKGNCNTGSVSADLLNSVTAYGAVPVQVLGLPDDYMYDAWDRQFYYAVDINATYEDSFKAITPKEFCNIEVQDASHVAITGNEDYTYGAIYLLMSFGKNGHGGYTKNGTQLLVSSAGDDEILNARISGVGLQTADGAAVYVQKEETPNFDDIVRYKERWQMQNDDDAWRSEYVGPEFAMAIYQNGSNNVKLYERQCGKYESYKNTAPSNYTVTLAMTGLAFTQSNSHLIVNHNGTCYVYKIYSTGEVGPAVDGTVSISCPAYVAVPPTTMAMSYNGYFAVASTAPWIKFWKFTNSGFLAFNDTSPAAVLSPALASGPTAMQFSRTGRYFAATRARATAWNRLFVRTGDRRYTRLTDPGTFPASASAIAFSDNEKFMAQVQNATTNIRVWSINDITNTFTLETTLTAPAISTAALSFSRGGKYLVAASGVPTAGAALSTQIKIFSINGTTFTSMDPTGNYTFNATSLQDAAFSNDGHFLVITVRGAAADQLGMVFRRSSPITFTLVDMLPGTLNVGEYPTLIRFAY